MTAKHLPLLLLAGTVALGLGAFGCGSGSDNEQRTLTFAPDSLAPGVVGQEYEVTFETRGAPTPVSSFRLHSGKLPPGLDLYECGADMPPCEEPLRLHGVPTESETYEFEISATTFGTQVAGLTGAATYILRIEPAAD